MKIPHIQQLPISQNNRLLYTILKFPDISVPAAGNQKFFRRTGHSCHRTMIFLCITGYEEFRQWKNFILPLW